MSEQITILIADDHPIFRRGLRMVVESDAALTVVAEVDNGADALAKIVEHEPDVAVLDVNMPQADGLEVAWTIQEKHLPTFPVFLTMHADEAIFNAAIDADVRGFVIKDGAAVDIGAFEQNITFDQPSALSNAYTGVNYNQQLSATSQTSFAAKSSFAESPNFAPATFEIVPIAGQSLPPGITLSNDGLLSGMPTMSETYTFTVKATDTDGIAGVQQFTIQVLAPSAATVNVSGRVSTSGGNRLTNATVVLTDQNGNTRTARTSSFGYYQFDEVEVGQTYTMTVRSRRYFFTPQIVTVNEEIVDLNFSAQ